MPVEITDIEVQRALQAPEALQAQLATDLGDATLAVEAVAHDSRWGAYSDVSLAEYDRAVQIEQTAREKIGAAWKRFQADRLQALGTLDGWATRCREMFAAKSDPRKYSGLDALRRDTLAAMEMARSPEELASILEERMERDAAWAAAVWSLAPQARDRAAGLAEDRPEAQAVARAAIDRTLQASLARAYPGAADWYAAWQQARQAIVALSTDVVARRAVAAARERARHLARRPPTLWQPVGRPRWTPRVRYPLVEPDNPDRWLATPIEQVVQPREPGVRVVA